MWYIYRERENPAEVDQFWLLTPFMSYVLSTSTHFESCNVRVFPKKRPCFFLRHGDGFQRYINLNGLNQKSNQEKPKSRWGKSPHARRTAKRRAWVVFAQWWMVRFCPPVFRRWRESYSIWTLEVPTCHHFSYGKVYEQPFLILRFVIIQKEPPFSMVVGFQGECKLQVGKVLGPYCPWNLVWKGFSAQDVLGRVSKQPYTPEG